MAFVRTEPELIRAAASGDTAAWNRLIAVWIPVVLGWARRLGGPDVDPEDVAHDVMLRVLDRIGQLREPEAFPGWVYQITRDIVRKRAAKRDRWAIVRTLIPRSAPHTPDMPDVAAGEAVLRLLQDLPESQREVIVLCLVEDHTREEAADLLGVPAGTVKSRLRLGVQKFRELASRQGLIEELEEVAAWRA